MTLLCIRDENGFRSLGVGLHWFLGAVRVRLIECDSKLVGNGLISEKVESIPEKYTVKIDEDEIWKDVKWQRPGVSVTHIEWENVKSLCTPEKLVKIKKAKPPSFGTLQYIHRFSSPLPATNLPPGFELRTSELFHVGHVSVAFNGVFSVHPLPKGYYIGEYLGKVVPTTRVGGQRTPYSIDIQTQDTHDCNGEKIPDCFRENKSACVLLAEQNNNSSFIRFVNTPTLWSGLFPSSQMGRLEPHRSGLQNAKFIQIQRRLYLVTTKKIPPGKEILAHRGDACILPQTRDRVLRAEMKRRGISTNDEITHKRIHSDGE